MKQRDQSDCGVTCLAYLCKRWGRPRPVALLRQWAGTDRNGTTALGLLQAGERSGLRMRGVKASPGECDQLPLPAVAHIVQGTRQLHYVVIEKVGARSARVMDPAVGKVESWKKEKLTGLCTGVFLLASKGDEPSSSSSNAVGLTQTRRWLDLLKPHRALLGQALVGALLATVLGLAMSLYVEKLVDSVIPEQDTRTLFLLSWVMVGVIAARVALSWLQGSLSLRIAQRIDTYLILGYYRHLMRLPKTFHDSMRVGERMARVADAAKIRSFLNQTLVNLCLHPLMVAVSLAALFFYDWRLALLAGGLLMVHALAYPLVHKVNGACQRRIAVKLAEWQSHLTESLQAQNSVRALGLVPKEILRAEQHLVRV
ncbi:MAG TPA: ABC transporter transmembrane domain-containing protein, partial [Opitutaceae bacterium]|nr:ABC transporter transmembrane domain-containing protein [Opitutaceae bacterium]